MGRSPRFVESAVTQGKVPLLSTFCEACEAAGLVVFVVGRDGRAHRLVSHRGDGQADR